MTLIEEIVELQKLPHPRERRQIRELAGVSLHRLAKELDVMPSTVLRWERGQTVPRPQSLVRYAELLRRIKKELA